MGGKVGDLKTIMMDPEIFKNCPNYTIQHPYVHVFFKLHIFNAETNVKFEDMKKFVLLILIWFH